MGSGEAGGGVNVADLDGGAEGAGGVGDAAADGTVADDEDRSAVQGEAGDVEEGVGPRGFPLAPERRQEGDPPGSRGELPEPLQLAGQAPTL